MLHIFGFERLGVAICDLYFLNPVQVESQEGPEHGVRLELRILERPTREGSIYATQGIEAGPAVWRADFLESVAGPVGSNDRTHHHPTFDGWEPCSREFVPEMSADPLGWLAKQLSNPKAILARAGLDERQVGQADFEGLISSAPEIVDLVGRLLERVRAGELAKAPDQESDMARTGWL